MRENNSDKNEQLPRLRQLIRQQRWAALATVGGNSEPQASMVAYAVAEKADELYLHLSTLAEHTRNLQQNPRASLVVGECDDGSGDPQQRARASLSGTMHIIEPDATDYAEAKAYYLARLPDAEQRFAFGDFRLLRFTIDKVRFVGGFAQAFSYRGNEL